MQNAGTEPKRATRLNAGDVVKLNPDDRRTVNWICKPLFGIWIYGGWTPEGGEYEEFQVCFERWFTVERVSR